MKTMCIDEVLGFYRKSYTNSVLLFHVGFSYVAYDNDAVIVNELLNDVIIEKIDNHEQLKFPDDRLEDVILRLAQNNIAVHWIDYRDENGNFVIPKVKQILSDMEDDY